MHAGQHRPLSWNAAVPDVNMWQHAAFGNKHHNRSTGPRTGPKTRHACQVTAARMNPYVSYTVVALLNGLRPGRELPYSLWK